MINFILPGMYEKFDINIKLIQLLKQHKEYFHDDINIYAVYGNFQFNIWDGGRIFTSYKHTTKEEIENIITTYNNLGIKVRQIFTNTELKEIHFHDRFGNLCLQLAENGFNEIVVNNDTFRDYIKKQYPNYNFISSTTKCLNDETLFLHELDKKEYFMICLDYNLNKNESILSKLSMEQKNKCEFLVNAICPAGCPNRKEHYKLNSLFSLSYGKSYKMQQCLIQSNSLFPKHSINNLSIDDIKQYNKNGFKYFKLEGRTFSDHELIGNYVKYLVKPEYQLFVYDYLLS